MSRSCRSNRPADRRRQSSARSAAGGSNPNCRDEDVMAVPWLRILDTVMGVTDLALGRSARSQPRSEGALTESGGAFGRLETKLTGVVIAALKEAFDRDNRRL